MDFILQQLVKTRNTDTNELKEEWSGTDFLQILETDGKRFFKAATQTPYPDSSASMTVGKTTKTVSHHVTCKELGFQKREVLIRRVNSISKSEEIYEIEVI